MTYRERRLRKADRLREWADKRRRKSADAFATARRIADSIPFGQPILVGHHSERRARRDQDRIHNGMSRGFEHQQKAADMQSRASNIEDAADRAIYSDDQDACEQLRLRIAGLEAERARIKMVNTLIRKKGIQAAMPDLTDAEKSDLLSLMRVSPYHQVETRGFPSYKLQNLSGNIARQKQRLAHLETVEAQRSRVREAMTAEGRDLDGETE